MKKFKFIIYGDTEFTIEDIWPDPEDPPPTNPSVNDVMEVIEMECMDVEDLVANWGMGNCLKLRIVEDGDAN